MLAPLPVPDEVPAVEPDCVCPSCGCAKAPSAGNANEGVGEVCGVADAEPATDTDTDKGGDIEEAELCEESVGTEGEGTGEKGIDRAGGRGNSVAVAAFGSAVDLSAVLPSVVVAVVLVSAGLSLSGGVCACPSLSRLGLSKRPCERCVGCSGSFSFSFAFSFSFSSFAFFNAETSGISHSMSVRRLLLVVGGDFACSGCAGDVGAVGVMVRVCVVAGLCVVAGVCVVACVVAVAAAVVGGD